MLLQTLRPVSYTHLFGSARNVENGGSLTIIATTLVDTGSKMDDMIYEEFKGTGNMEIHLSRKLSELRIFPAIDIYKSGTRKDNLLLTEEEMQTANLIRRKLSNTNTNEIMENLVKNIKKTKDNKMCIRDRNIIEISFSITIKMSMLELEN